MLDLYLYDADGTPQENVAPEEDMGPYSRETLGRVTEENLGKTSALGVAAMALGLPLGPAIRQSFAAMGPLGAFSDVSELAYSGLLDKAYKDALSEANIDTSKVTTKDYNAAIQAMDVASKHGRPMEVADVGYDAQYAAAQKAQMDDAGFTGRLGMAFNALKDIFQPTSNNMGTTDFSRATGLHPGMEGTPSGRLAAEVAGLESSFSDPFGIGIGRGGGEGGGSTGGNMGGGAAPGGVSGDRGNRGSGMGAGII